MHQDRAASISPAGRRFSDEGTRELAVPDFARALGTTPERVPAPVSQSIGQADFRYRSLSSEERDAVILDVLQRLDSGELTQVGEHRRNVWEKGWEENLLAFAQSGLALESLVPRFIRPQPILRLAGNYIRALDPRFELHFHEVMRQWLYLEYMEGAGAVYEFGCGSGYNLVAFASLCPGLRLVGLDWAESSVKLVSAIGEQRGLNLRGRLFDLFHPDDSVDIGHDDVALTICALEQLGPGHDAFVRFLLRKRPWLCVHMEPLLELYDENDLVDYLAIRYHTSRCYLSGFLSRLKELEMEKQLEIVKVQRTRFGSLYHEGYSYVVWRPV